MAHRLDWLVDLQTYVPMIVLANKVRAEEL